MIHDLKIHPVHFVHVKSGHKKFELRKNDRPYAVGHTLRLREWCPDRECYTGNEVITKITHTLRGPRPGLSEGYVILSIG